MRDIHEYEPGVEQRPGEGHLLRRFDPILLMLALAGALPRLWLGSSQFVEYDGYWHVFIAQQDNWTNFWRDIAANAHPPLFFLLLKLVLHLGRSLLVYRAISIATGVASTYLVGKIARRVNCSAVSAWVAALVFAGALPAIIIACEVRSYMLCTFFVLWSFVYFLDFVTDKSGAGQLHARIAFAFLTIAACLSHYFAFFYVGACAAVVVIRTVAAIVHDRRAVARYWRDFVTVAPVIASALVLYQAHAGRLAVIQQHLLPYYYDPRLAESTGSFVVRNSANFFNLFSPFGTLGQRFAAGSFAAALIAGVIVFVWLVRRRDSRTVPATTTIGVSALMLGSTVLAAIAGKYPYGGDLRQQFLLFPFIVVCASLAYDRAVLRFRPRAQALAGGAVFVFVIATSAVQFYRCPKVETPVGADRMAAFDHLIPSPKALYIDQYNLILFFQFHDQWQWNFLHGAADLPGVDVYRVTNGPRSLLVFRDTQRWILDPEDPSVYRGIAELLHSHAAPELAVFCVFAKQRSHVRQAVATQASRSSVCIDKAQLNRMTWFALFSSPPCAVPEMTAIGASGRYDNESEELEYTGTWTHGRYPSAPESVIFSNQPAATARLSFTGSEIEYVYTKAYNAGIATVKIDGVERDTLDLYSPAIVWQNTKTWTHLAPGRHTFELVVTGRHQPASSDSYVFLESLVVR